MTNPVSRTATLSPSPRHMRRRRFRGDVPSSLLPGHQRSETMLGHTRPAAVNRISSPRPAVKAPAGKTPEPPSTPSKDVSLRRKRFVAFAVVTLVSLSIPILALTLMFGR